MFSSSLGTDMFCPYDIKVSATTLVRTKPYFCAVPMLQKFKLIVKELLEQGFVRPCKSLYANPDFLAQRNVTEFRMVVEYRNVNAKIRFDSYHMPSIDQAFDQFSRAMIFSVFDINTSYFQVPFTHRSRRITALFYTLWVVRF